MSHYQAFSQAVWDKIDRSRRRGQMTTHEIPAGAVELLRQLPRGPILVEASTLSLDATWAVQEVELEMEFQLSDSGILSQSALGPFDMRGNSAALLCVNQAFLALQCSRLEAVVEESGGHTLDYGYISRSRRLRVWAHALLSDEELQEMGFHTEEIAEHLRRHGELESFTRGGREFRFDWQAKEWLDFPLLEPGLPVLRMPVSPPMTVAPPVSPLLEAPVTTRVEYVGRQMGKLEAQRRRLAEWQVATTAMIPTTVRQVASALGVPESVLSPMLEPEADAQPPVRVEDLHSISFESWWKAAEDTACHGPGEQA